MKRRRRGDSEDEREKLAKARRERARRARADLAAKAKGEEPETEAEDEDAKPATEAEGAKPAKAESEKARAEADAEAKRERRRAAREKLARGHERDGSSEPGKGERSETPAKRKRGKRSGSEEEPERGGRRRPERKPVRGGRKLRPGKGNEAETGSETGGRSKRVEGKPAAGEESKRGEKGKPGEKGDSARRTLRRRPATAKGRRRPGGGKRSRTEAKRAGARAKSAGRSALVALGRGAAETKVRVRRAAPRAGRGALSLIVAAFALFFTGLGFLLGAGIAVLRRTVPPVRRALLLGRRLLDAVSRQVTPVRVLALVVASAAVLLALSQFADYRNISIGNDAYADGIQTVAPAPVRETDVTGSAHSYLMVPLAAVALVLLGAALTGRWRLCRLIALAGLIAIAVGLIHDRPTGLDPGEQAVVYTGVKARLLGGFYAELFAGLLLTLSALLLGRELRLAGARRPARASRGSRARRKLLRRDPRVEGARA